MPLIYTSHPLQPHNIETTPVGAGLPANKRYPYRETIAFTSMPMSSVTAQAKIQPRKNTQNRNPKTNPYHTK
jgi:hypothetical protein